MNSRQHTSAFSYDLFSHLGTDGDSSICVFPFSDWCKHIQRNTQYRHTHKENKRPGKGWKTMSTGVTYSLGYKDFIHTAHTYHGNALFLAYYSHCHQNHCHNQGSPCCEIQGTKRTESIKWQLQQQLLQYWHCGTTSCDKRLSLSDWEILAL